MEKLFTEFKHTNAADWKNQLIKELKGEDYESLRWKNENGFTIEPFYTSEDLKTAYSPAFSHCDWEICVKGKRENANELNEQLLNDLNRGATSILLHPANLQAEQILKDISLQYIHATFFINPGNAKNLLNYFEKNYSLNDLNVSLFPETFTGTNNLNEWSELTNHLKPFTNIRLLSFDATPYHNLNCVASTEVAIILSGVVEMLEYYSGKKFPDSAVTIKTGVSSDYFMQIAKLRSIRRLWEILKMEYKIDNELHLIVETGLTNKSISDSYNNLLRSTMEAMAAVAGGCNELVVNEFDTLFRSNTELSERMAINQQLILKHESYLDKMADLSCGSYYIESLTDAIAQTALAKFKEYEKQGGYFKCVEKRIFLNEIETQAGKYSEDFNSLKHIAIGINKFRNEKEKTELTNSQIASIRKTEINNPVAEYELQNFFKQHA